MLQVAEVVFLAFQHYFVAWNKGLYVCMYVLHPYRKWLQWFWTGVSYSFNHISNRNNSRM